MNFEKSVQDFGGQCSLGGRENCIPYRSLPVLRLRDVQLTQYRCWEYHFLESIQLVATGAKMIFSEYNYLLRSDLYRITGNAKTSTLLRQLLSGGLYKYNFWIRTCRYARSNNFLKYISYPIAKIILKRLKYKLGISINPFTEIGSGFYIGHFGGIFIHGGSVIGKNCNISQDVTIGQKNRGQFKGYPVIGDNVYIGPGAKIIGGIRIGNNVAIGANCVVTKDIPDDSVVVGIPGRVISKAGSVGYVEKIDYDRIIRSK